MKGGFKDGEWEYMSIDVQKMKPSIKVTQSYVFSKIATFETLLNYATFLTFQTILDSFQSNMREISE